MSSSGSKARKVPKIPQGRITAFFIVAALCVFWLASSGAYNCVMPGRVATFACAVALNTGFGHMTRGMNTYTIEALDKAADRGEKDVPALQQLLLGGDRIAAMTAAEVLKKRGKAGKRALKDAEKTARDAGNVKRALLIGEYGAEE
ncbi:MAG: hypothetical protein GC185_05440 [Alphaproteobacteria bacterium]|nr:hypothetical protein [Alphaproteobacteria bacterium]